MGSGHWLSEGTTMQTTVGRSRSCVISLMTLFAMAALLVEGCAGGSGEPTSAVELDAFRSLARTGGCADIRNRLFLIDDHLVFWDRVGNCADGAYAETLYDSTPDQVLCVFHDSIAGPVKNCQDERYQDMFDTITINLDSPDLGLGSKHAVQPVQF
jgi:hypothetical protein